MKNTIMKLYDGEINVQETDVYLYESWYQKILNSINSDEVFPKLFDITSSFVHPKTKDVIYIGESKCLKSTTRQKPKKKLAFSEFTLRFILGNEFDLAENSGFSFNEYLPMTNTNILITSITTLSDIQPARFELSVEDITLPDHTHCLLLSFVINFLNGRGFTNLRYYTRKIHRASWKLIYSDDVSCMTSYEKMFRDTFIHKQLVIESANVLAKFLRNEGAILHSENLIKRAQIHDDSKISNEDELIALSRIRNNGSLRDANETLSEIGKEALIIHHKNNSHHPEHFESPLDMSKLDIMEMCCDWHARSKQYGTNFLEFVKIRQQTRFDFPDFMFLEIMFYCNILENGSKKKTNP